MSPLTQSEYDLLLDCIRELHSIRELPSLRFWLLDVALPELVPSDWIGYNEVDLQTPEASLAIVRPEKELLFQRLFPRFKELAHQHPLISRQMESDDFPVHTISDFLTQDAFHRLALYQEVYRHLGVEYQIAATVKTEPARITAIALSRRAHDYTERDRALLELLRPHLVVAFNNLALIKEHKIKWDAAVLALNELSAATIVLNTQGRILYHTGPGLQWIGATSPGNVPAKLSNWLNQRDSTGFPKTMKLVSDAGTIHIRALPTSSTDRLLLVITREPEGSLSAIVTDDPSLSNREMEVARWICNGKSNSEIARILGISPRTVHKHVEHIFERLGVESRVALTVRLMKNFR